MAGGLEQLISLGCEHIYINTHYLHKQVEALLRIANISLMSLLSMKLNYWGTLGSVRNIVRHLEGDSELLIAHADNFCVTDWQQFIQVHHSRPIGCDLTLMLF